MLNKINKFKNLNYGIRSLMGVFLKFFFSFSYKRGLKVLYRFFRPIFIPIAILIISLLFYINLTPAIAKFIGTYLKPILTWEGINFFLFLSQTTAISLLELSSYLLVILIVLFFYLILRRKYAKAQILLKASIIFLTIYLHWFYLTWGYAYQLSYPIGNIGNFKPSAREIKTLKNDISMSLGQFSSRPTDVSLEVFVPDMLQIMDDFLISSEYSNNRQITNYYPRIKTFSIIPYMMKLFGAAGFYNPLFAEVHVNGEMPSVFKIFTLVHELSHARGITSEYQANVIAYEVSRQYDDDLAQYSLLLNLSLHLFPYLNRKERKEFLNLAPPFFKEDILDYYAYWRDVFNPIARFNRWVYDMYLKRNGIEDGVQSYGRFISYIIYQQQNTGRPNLKMVK